MAGKWRTFRVVRLRGRNCRPRSASVRGRNTDWQQIIYAPSHDVGGASGCWEPFVDEILARLGAQGVEARYEPGRLD